MNLCRCNESLLAVIDLQPKFLAPISDAKRVVDRARFLIQAATLLDVPMIATEQVPDRMGATDATILDTMGRGCRVCPKSQFGAAGVLDLMGRSQVVLVGIETHICVTQTALTLLEEGVEVFIAADAVSCRSSEAHDIALRRLAQSGAVITHSESVVYEWLEDAAHPKFRELLQWVKANPL